MTRTNDTHRSCRRRTNVWLVAGVIVLIVLLFGWLTFADIAGDTDVSAESNFATDTQVPSNAR